MGYKIYKRVRFKTEDDEVWDWKESLSKIGYFFMGIYHLLIFLFYSWVKIAYGRYKLKKRIRTTEDVLLDQILDPNCSTKQVMNSFKSHSNAKINLSRYNLAVSNAKKSVKKSLRLA